MPALASQPSRVKPPGPRRRLKPRADGALPFAFSVSHFINSVGADAGFASIIGLAILVLLYFAQARETRRCATAPTRPNSAPAARGAARAGLACAVAPNAAGGRSAARPARPLVNPAPGVTVAPAGGPVVAGAPAAAVAASRTPVGAGRRRRSGTHVRDAPDSAPGCGRRRSGRRRGRSCGGVRAFSRRGRDAGRVRRRSIAAAPAGGPPPDRPQPDVPQPRSARRDRRPSPAGRGFGSPLRQPASPGATGPVTPAPARNGTAEHADAGLAAPVPRRAADQPAAAAARPAPSGARRCAPGRPPRRPGCTR